MSHGFTSSDTMFSVRQVPWHGIGQVVEEAPTAKEAIKLAGLDWTVGKYQLECKGKVIDGKYGILRDDTEEFLGGPVSEQYKEVQNSEAFEFLDNLVGKGLHYETAGSILGGRKVFITAKMDEVLRIGDDKIDTYLLLSNGHTGIDSLQCAITPVRVVCQNTLQLAMKKFKRKWAIVHSQRLEERISQARKALELTGEYMLNFCELGERLIDKKITEDQADKVFEIAYKYEEGKTTNLATLRRKMDQFWGAMEVDDLKPYSGTAWQVINAISDIETHQKGWSSDRKMDACIEGGFKMTSDVLNYVLAL